jgi:tetratricopeptide (TPR) repeat protein
MSDFTVLTMTPAPVICDARRSQPAQAATPFTARGRKVIPVPPSAKTLSVPATDFRSAGRRQWSDVRREWSAVVAALCCAVTLVGCANTPNKAADKPDGHDPAALTVVAEIALARGDCRSASESYAEAAQHGAAPLARRASEVALGCEHVPAAWKSASRWRTLAPADREAAAMYATVAAKLYRIPDARAGIVDFAKAQSSTTAAAAVAAQATPDDQAGGNTGHPKGAAAPTADAAGLSELAGLMLEQSDPPAVLAAMSSALDANAVSPDTDALLSEIALSANDASRAQRYAQQALERDPKQIGAKRVLARAYVVRGDATRAIETAREVMREDSTRSAFELAEVLVALDRIEEAHQELERLRSSKVSAGEVDRRLALLAYNAGDMKEAQQRFAELASHGEGTDASLLYLADIAARDGDQDAALAGYRRLADSAFALEARSKAAAILLNRNSRSEAILLMDDYINDHPESEFESRLSEARLLADHGDADEGLKLLATALDKHPQHPAIEYDRAVILERAGRVHESVEALEHLLQQRPEDPVLMNALGYTLADHSLDLPRADGLIHKALSLTPDSPAVLDSLGWVRFRQGDPKGAVVSLEHAYALDHDSEIAAHWGEALWVSGKHQEARRVWAAAVARGAESPLLKATMSRLLTDAQ